MERLMEAIRAVRNRAGRNERPALPQGAGVRRDGLCLHLCRRSAVYAAPGLGVGGSCGLRLRSAGGGEHRHPDATIKIPMDELVDREAERARLQKERDGVQKQLDGVLARLENKAFTDKAPEAVVAGARENAARLRDKLHLLEQSLAALS